MYAASNSTEKAGYGLIAIYGDTPDSAISRAISAAISDREIRILTPGSKETLEQAAQNSALVIIGISGESDPGFILARGLQDDRLVMADILAFCLNDYAAAPMKMMGRGFDACITPEDVKLPEFKKFLMQKISSGSRRLSGLIQEEEYRRICDALSSAPASMLVFDSDKRAVFVSDHYFRAYPRIAPRLIRGLSVYDAFGMMMKEEEIGEDDDRHERLQRFWHNLEGSVEYAQNNGTLLRLRAVRLPNKRGTVVIGQNLSDLHQRRAISD